MTSPMNRASCPSERRRMEAWSTLCPGVGKNDIPSRHSVPSTSISSASPDSMMGATLWSYTYEAGCLTGLPSVGGGKSGAGLWPDRLALYRCSEREKIYFAFGKVGTQHPSS